jgi:asparagine synthase (glutamine-hydrolysing)
VTDVELILYAYQAWSDDCLKHLIGDFAFAIWDGPKKRLFCARDHFGVKPFYYAQFKNHLIFSNTLNCVRIHPEISERVNDQAIGDFLLFDENCDSSTTFFADIQRLAPAHSLVWNEKGFHLNRYWTLPFDGHIRYKRSGDYIDHFKEVLNLAVEDRLRTDHVGVFMSGGIDSTAIAATAHHLLVKKSKPFDLRAYTAVYDTLIPDEERHYSGLAAEALGIPIHYLKVDDYLLYERWDQKELHSPEPFSHPMAVMGFDFYKLLEGRSRVALTGSGGDPLFYTTQLVDLVKGLSWGRLVADVGRFVWSHRRLPPLGIRSKLKQMFGKGPWRPPYPSWFNATFEKRLQLQERWEKLNSLEASIHPLRSKAYKALNHLTWSNYFENCDPGVTFFPVEERHAFFDIRLINYLLAIPPLPWFVEKELVRTTMRGILPEAILNRSKAPLAGDPVFEQLKTPSSKWVDQFDPVPELAQYVERKHIPHLVGERNTDQLWVNLRPLGLNYWLKELKRTKRGQIKEDKCYQIA